jgi:hypothetical protein
MDKTVSYEDFITELGKAGLSVRGFAELLGMRPNSVSNNAKRREVPSHLAVIAALLAELHIRGIPYEPIISRLSLCRKKPRGGASSGKFGGDKQGRLELGS